VKAILGKKKKIVVVVSHRSFLKVKEQTKIKILEEVKMGIISYLNPIRK